MNELTNNDTIYLSIVEILIREYGMTASEISPDIIFWKEPLLFDEYNMCDLLMELELIYKISIPDELYTWETMTVNNLTNIISQKIKNQ